jgi:pSer/pThr/pTyr-binding forkhead associated (FHA) protein
MTSPISAVKLLVSGHEQAIVLDDNRENAVLGRTSGIGEAPAVDLSDYGAYMQGVSRHHASIRVNANACTIQDLGSANGTWVNQQRLPAYQPYPLKTGDEITLGKLRLVVDIQLVS